jgi:hypothetical protein
LTGILENLHLLGRASAGQFRLGFVCAGLGLPEIFQVFFHGFLVKLLGFALHDFQRAGGAFTHARPKAVAQVVGNDPGLAFDDRNGAFGTGNNALAAAVAEILVDFYDFSQGFHYFLR